LKLFPAFSSGKQPVCLQSAAASRIGGLAAVLLSGLSLSATAQQALSPQELEAAGAVIGDINIVTVNVFDLDDPADNKKLFRLANRLHILTRPAIIEQQLLFKSGDVFSERLARETARLLRDQSYLYEASVTPVRAGNGTVDLEVRTQDVWTLNPGISFDRAGGENSASIKIEESNLLGLGKEVQLEYESDVDRASTRLAYYDPLVLGSRNRLRAGYADNSDGRQQEFQLDRPFYSLDSRWSAGLGGLDWTRTDSRYDHAEVVDEFRHDEQRYGAHFGLSRGLRSGWVQRWTYGFAYERHHFSPSAGLVPAAMVPADRTLAFPLVGFELLEDSYEERRNENQIARTEDVYTGAFLRGMLGWSSPSFGASRTATIVSLEAGRSFELADRRHTVLLAASADGRIEDGSLRNAALAADAQYYWRASERQLFFASLTGVLTHHPDAETQLLLGGDAAGLTTTSPRNPSATEPLFSGSDTSLRGYPLRYQDGTALALLTLEHRVYTDYYLFRLFHVGGAVFFDAGRTWGKGNAGGTSEGWLTDAGFGLRFASSRSSFGNVIHVDLAFPFDGDSSIDNVQFLVETKRSF
jgi:outer membrane protein assembly factor BamA